MLLIYNRFLEWRRDIERMASQCLERSRGCPAACGSTKDDPAFSRHNTTADACASGVSVRPPSTIAAFTEPSFDSDEWWACLIYEKLRNYDAAKARHRADISSAPSNLSSLPVFRASYEPVPEEKSNQDMPESASDDEPPAQWNNASTDRCARAPRLPVPTPVLCGQLPEGKDLNHFHRPPSTIHCRGAEAKYWNEFSTQSSQVFVDEDTAAGEEDPARTVDVPWGISAHSAMEAADKQKKLFETMDKYITEIDGETSALPSERKRNPYDATVDAAIRQLTDTYRKSPTVVMEAAFFLLKEGLLNVPDVGCINVKQARALLWNAVWLQEFMNERWTDEACFLSLDRSQERSNLAQRFRLAIIGPGGTGKTAVLKVAEALTCFLRGLKQLKSWHHPTQPHDC